jgi:trimeric autotransporter adhesin
MGFGSAVALAGDTLVVGAPLESSAAKGIGGDQNDASAISAGAVYVFTRNGTTWTQQAYLKASDTTAISRFGCSVALSGDTLAVGADYAPNGARVGAAYVFVRTGTAWAQQGPPLVAKNARADSYFGAHVAIAGDLLAVAATGESSSGAGVDGATTPTTPTVASGAVYLFARKGAVWSQQTFIKSAHPTAAAAFGYAIGLTSDLLAVGAPNDANAADGTPDPSGPSGAVIVFGRAGATWKQTAFLRAPNPGSNAGFGFALALAPDVLLVGAPYEASAARGIDGDPFAKPSTVQAGSAYALTRAGPTWTTARYFKATNNQLAGAFGTAVAMSASNVLVGAIGEASKAVGVNGDQSDRTLAGAGAAYLW